MTDQELMRKYVEERSEEAFRELVSRYVQLVFSVALRTVEGNVPLAEDVTQKSFTLLARRADRLSSGVVIAGWLYRTARNIGCEAMRSERRRRHYEKEAACMADHENQNNQKEQFTALLDTAMATLPEKDRIAILLRFFQRKSMRELGEALGVSEDAAKMRVSRAVERLRQQLGKLGFGASSSAVMLLLTEAVVEARPLFSAGIAERAVRNAAIQDGLPVMEAILIMMTTKKLAALAVGALLALVLSSQIKRDFSVESAVSAEAVGGAGDRGGAAGNRSRGQAPTPAAVEERALLELRHALNAPWETRQMPSARVENALIPLESNPSAAQAVLMEVMNTPRRERSFEAFLLAAHGLTILGTNAASAIPDLLRLAGEGDLAILNDLGPKLWKAVSPDGKVIPQLIATMSTLPVGATGIGLAINELISANPHLERVHAPVLRELLHHSDLQVRGHAATVLARLPTLKDQAALPVLIGALNLEKLRDPKAYDPVVLKAEGTTIMKEGERWQDDLWRYQAVQALKDFGPAAEEALPALLELAELTTTTNRLHQLALVAVGSINGNSGAQGVMAAVDQNSRALELSAKAQEGRASFEELVEGLRDWRSVGRAAERLQKSPAEARKAAPELLKALDRFDDYFAAQALKEAAPELLVKRLEEGNYKGLGKVAIALGDLGPSVSYALPYLEEALSSLSPDERGVISAVEKAILKINPGYPKPVFRFDDLYPATSALLDAIYSGGKLSSPVYKAWISDMQDLNNLPRQHLLNFIEKTKADPDLHRVFMEKLVEQNPALGMELQDSGISAPSY